MPAVRSLQDRPSSELQLQVSPLEGSRPPAGNDGLACGSALPLCCCPAIPVSPLNLRREPMPSETTRQSDRESLPAFEPSAGVDAEPGKTFRDRQEVRRRRSEPPSEAVPY